MRSKEYVQQEIDRVKRNLDTLDSLRLGMLLKQCYYSSLRYEIDRDIEYRYKCFGFTVHPHDTGIGVVCKLYSPDGDSLEIINRTYWYSESTYGWNKYTELHGVWDGALQEAIAHIRQTEREYLCNQLNGLIFELEQINKTECSKIDKFSAMFQG